jgi:hypothetical protein
MNLYRDQTSGFCLSINGLGVIIETESIDLNASLRTKYLDFLKVIDPQLSIQVRLASARLDNFASLPGMNITLDQMEFNNPGLQGRINFNTGYGHLVVFSSNPEVTIDYVLRNIIAILAVRNGGLMLHGAGVIHRGAGCLFFGPSGSGKTTVAAHKLNQDILLNDDLVLVMKANDQWNLHSTPFTHPGQQHPTYASGPLFGLFRLVQDRQVFLEDVSRGQALAELVGSLPVLAAIPSMTGLLLARVEEMIDTVPIFRLHFLPDHSFWKVVGPVILTNKL